MPAKFMQTAGNLKIFWLRVFCFCYYPLQVKPPCSLTRVLASSSRGFYVLY
jgi:hypothetical protein